MTFETEVKDKIFSPGTEDFEDLALAVFQYQARQNSVYREYLNLLKIKPDGVKKVAQIPFLPIEVFKRQAVITGNKPAELVFESSRTAGIPSLHYVPEPSLYERSILEGFRLFFGPPEDYVFLALLPSYLERSGSSLVYMVDYLMRLSKHPESGYFLYDHAALAERLKLLMAQGRKVFLIGVSFALLDFAEAFPMPLHNTIVMETGGMKGRKKELIREELHAQLCQAFSLESIASEYGMTELLSQAYALRNGHFHTPPWMQIRIRESQDPFAWAESGQAGGISVIDLANLYSCAFIAIQDLGRQLPDGSVEVLGRFDNAEIRGCSLLWA